MVIDTPIVDRAVRENIGDEGNILRRLERAEMFRRYLDSQWSKIEAAVEVFNWETSKFSVECRDKLHQSRLGVDDQTVGTVQVQETCRVFEHPK